MTDIFADMIRTSWLHYLAASVDSGRIILDEASFIYDTICETIINACIEANEELKGIAE